MKRLIYVVLFAAVCMTPLIADRFGGHHYKVTPNGITSTAALMKTGLGIESGMVTSATDGTVTNTFTSTFTVAPIVTFSAVATAGKTNVMSAPTTTSVIFTVGEASKVIHYIAIGAPTGDP